MLAASEPAAERALLAPWAEAIRRQCDRAPFQAIPDLAYFAGREEELQLLRRALLSDKPSPIVCLQGMGGAGKTALAAHLAYQLRPCFPAGVLWVRSNLASPRSALEVLARTCADAPRGRPGRAERSVSARDLLAQKRALLILDHVKHAADIQALLPGNGSCAVLITSRRHDLPLPAEALRVPIGPFQRERCEAMEVFARFLEPAHVRQEKQDLIAIADLIGHLPLAVVIAASRMAYEPGWSAAGFAARMRQEPRRLHELDYENLSVRRSFAAGYDALSPPLRRCFVALGLLGEDFGTAAVAAVTAQPVEEAREQMRQLCSVSLVQHERPDRYRLHPLLRDYARERLPAVKRAVLF